jgi:hypothetical protein
MLYSCRVGWVYGQLLRFLFWFCVVFVLVDWDWEMTQPRVGVGPGCYVQRKRTTHLLMTVCIERGFITA